MNLDEYPFEWICTLNPLHNPEGAIATFMPQPHYQNRHNLPLNRYGVGPFCKFKIPGKFTMSGVYAIVAENEALYIGECVNLSARYNMGYGNISPRNCFIGGQETNCRLNNLIYHATSSGVELSLWFLPTKDYKMIELRLRASQRPIWTRC
jgi:hypothetical protein